MANLNSGVPMVITLKVVVGGFCSSLCEGIEQIGTLFEAHDASLSGKNIIG